MSASPLRRNEICFRLRIWLRPGFLCAVSRAKSFLIYWLPVVVWMVLIFSASADTGSAKHSSRIIEPILRWLFPQMEQPTINLIVFLVRKCAHLTEYAILALLCWRAIRKPVRRDHRQWNPRQAALALLLCAAYAASDEIHQCYVPNREGRFHDVVIDSLGAGAGLLALWAVGKWRRQWGSPATATVLSSPEKSN